MKKLNNKEYERIAELFKIMANPKRIAILKIISTENPTVNQLADRLKIAKSNVCQHLAVLRMSGITTSTRKGKFVFYKLSNSPEIKKILSIF